MNEFSELFLQRSATTYSWHLHNNGHKIHHIIWMRFDNAILFGYFNIFLENPLNRNTSKHMFED